MTPDIMPGAASLSSTIAALAVAISRLGDETRYLAQLLVGLSTWASACGMLCSKLSHVEPPDDGEAAAAQTLLWVTAGVGLAAEGAGLVG